MLYVTRQIHKTMSKKLRLDIIHSYREMLPYTAIYLVAGMLTLVLFSLLNYHFFGNILLDNDELKFFYHGKGHVFGSELRTLRIQSDFYGYVWVLKKINEIGLGLNGFTNKLLSFIFSTFYLCFLYSIYKCSAGFKKSQILLVVLSPILIYYSISGVRDALFTFALLAFVVEIVNFSRFSITVALRLALITAFGFAIRPESVLFFLAFYLLYRIFSGWPEKSVFILIVFFLVGLVLAVVIFRSAIVEFYTGKALGGTKNSTGGGLEAARSLPFPFDFLMLGIANILGSLPNTNYLSFNAKSDFDGLGASYYHGVFYPPTSFILYIGIVFHNFMFVFIVLKFFQCLKSMLKSVRLSKEDAVYCASFVLLFLLGRFTIEHGKASAFYPYLYMGAVIYFYRSKQKCFLLLASGGFVLLIHSLYFYLKL